MLNENVYYIVAGNIGQFRAYQNRKLREYKDYWNNLGVTPNVSFPDYKYVESVEKLRGLNSIRGFYIGTYKDRLDWKYIEEMIQIIKAKGG